MLSKKEKLHFDYKWSFYYNYAKAVTSNSLFVLSLTINLHP